MTNFQLHKDRVHGSFGLTLGVTTASIAFVMELTLLPLLLSAIQRDLGLSVVELAWVFNAYAVAVALAVLGVAFVGDKMDKRKLFLSGVALFAIGSMLSAMTDGLNALILSRIVQGIGGGLFSPLVPVLLTQANPEQSGRILMIWGGLAGVAAAVLPILGASLLAGFGWPAVFVGAGLACCNSPSTHLLLRVSPKDLRAISSCLDITAARCGGVAFVTLLTMMSPLSVLLAVVAFSGLAMFASQLFQQDFQTAE